MGLSAGGNDHAPQAVDNEGAYSRLQTVGSVMSLNLQLDRSDHSVAAWAKQASMMAAHIRELGPQTALKLMGTGISSHALEKAVSDSSTSNRAEPDTCAVELAKPGRLLSGAKQVVHAGVGRELGSADSRRKLDRDKKRRKRERIGELYKQLDHCLPPLCSRQRSLIEVLQDSCAAIRAMKDTSHDSHNSRPSGSGVKQETDSGPEHKSSGAGANFVTSDMRDVMMSTTQQGLLLVDENLIVLDANDKIECMVFGSAVRNGQRSGKLLISLTGKKLSELVHPADYQHLRVALNNVATSIYASEEDRIFTVGVRFRDAGGHKSSQSVDRGDKYGESWQHLVPVDVTTIEGGGGKLFLLRATPVDLTKTDDQVLAAFSACLKNGRESFVPFDPSAYMPTEMYKEVDHEGEPKTPSYMVDYDPFYALARLLEMPEAALDDFEQFLAQHDMRAAQTLDILRGSLASPQLDVVASHVQEKSFVQSLKTFASRTGGFITLKAEAEPDGFIIRQAIAGITFWEFKICKVGGRVVSRPRMPTLTATCLECEIALLENGDVYLFFRHPQFLPNANMQLYMNGIISRDLFGEDTIAFRKCAIHNSKDCYSRQERWRSSGRPTKQHDMSFLFSLLALFHAWNQAKQFVGALPLHLPSQHFTQGSQKSSDSRQEKPNGETTGTLSSPRLSRSDSHCSFASFMYNSRPSTPTPPALDSFSRCSSWILPPIDPSRSVHLTPEPPELPPLFLTSTISGLSQRENSECGLLAIGPGLTPEPAEARVSL